MPIFCSGEMGLSGLRANDGLSFDAALPSFALRPRLVPGARDVNDAGTPASHLKEVDTRDLARNAVTGCYGAAYANNDYPDDSGYNYIK